MKASLKFWTVLLCAGLVIGGCCDDPIAPEIPSTGDDNPPVEQPEKPLTDGSLFTVQLNDDIMATVGTGTWNKIINNDGTYYAIGEDGIATSSNGNTWTLQSLKEYSGVLQSAGVSPVNHLLYAISDTGDLIFGSGSNLNVMHNALPEINDANARWRDIAFGNNAVVAVSSSISAASMNRIAYGSKLVIDFSLASFSIKYGRESVAFGNDTFVAVSSYSRYASLSTNGIDWESSDDLLRPGEDFPDKIAFGNGVFIAIDSISGYCFISNDSGKTWSNKELSILKGAKDICFSNGIFVVVGNNGLVCYSSDNGVSFNKVESGISQNLNCVCIMQ